MREIFYRAAKGAVFVPVGAVAASLLWVAIAALISLFRPGLGATSFVEGVLGVLAVVAMVSITAAFIGFIFALAVGVPLLTVLIYTKADHWIVCGIAGAGCGAFFAGSPEHWGAMEANVVFAGAAGGIAAWFGSRPNSTPHADARASAVLEQPPSARAGGRGR
jgi:hypothetical protein